MKSDFVTREEWSSVTVDQAIPEETFASGTPAGWTQWKLPDEEDRLLKPGSKAPDFDLTSVDGGRIKLSDFRGKTVWLCFWRVGCPPCREEMPYLQSLYAKYRDQGLVVLGVDVLDDRAVTRKFLREQGVTFPNILDASPGAEEIYSRDYRVGSIPLNYLINGDGVVVDGWIGNLEGHARVNSALKTLGFGARIEAVRPDPCRHIWASADPTVLRSCMLLHGSELIRERLQPFAVDPYYGLPDCPEAHEAAKGVAEIDDLVLSGKTIEAIRRYRGLTRTKWGQAGEEIRAWHNLKRARKLAMFGWHSKDEEVDDKPVPEHPMRDRWIDG